MIITLTGPSGSGKSSVVSFMKKKYGADEIISTTTRAPRKREKDGVDYRFIDAEDFNPKDFFEHTTFEGYQYGKLKSDIKAAEKDTFENVHFVIVDRKGANYYKAHAKNVFTVYIEASPDFAQTHLARRDGKKKARARLEEDAAQGLFCRDGYDCIVRNDERMTIASLAYQIQNFIISLIERKKYKLLRKEAA